MTQAGGTFDRRLYEVALERIDALERELIYAKRMLVKPYHHFDDPKNPCPCCGSYKANDEAGP